MNPSDPKAQLIERIVSLANTSPCESVAHYTCREMAEAIASAWIEGLEKAKAEGAASYIKHTYGERCEVKDTDDFPELKDNPKATRCLVCEQWEMYDMWLRIALTNKSKEG